MKPQSIATFSSQSKLSMHNKSHAISKPKPPTVRIIHIFAPEIINTNVANFRQLVQRLTGKPEEKSKTRNSSMLPPKQHTTNQCHKNFDQNKKRRHNDDDIPPKVRSLKQMKKESEEIYGCENLNNGYLHGFGDMDGFNIQDLVVDFPLVPFKSSQMNILSEISHYAN